MSGNLQRARPAQARGADAGEAAERCVSRAAGKLGHALRNPLTAIKAGTQLVRHLTRPGDEVAEYFETILEETERLERIATRIQQLARLEPGPLEAFPLEALLADLERALGPAAHDRGVRLELPGPAAQRLRVGARRGLLEVALRELVENALACTPEGGSVAIGARRGRAGLLSLSVDGGCAGIAPALGARLFEPFHSPAGRTGLGLNIAERACLLGETPLTWSNRRGGGCRFALAVRAEGG